MFQHIHGLQKHTLPTFILATGFTSNQSTYDNAQWSSLKGEEDFQIQNKSIIIIRNRYSVNETLLFCSVHETSIACLSVLAERSLVCGSF